MLVNSLDAEHPTTLHHSALVPHLAAMRSFPHLDDHGIDSRHWTDSGPGHHTAADGLSVAAGESDASERHPLALGTPVERGIEDLCG